MVMAPSANPFCTATLNQATSSLTAIATSRYSVPVCSRDTRPICLLLLTPLNFASPPPLSQVGDFGLAKELGSASKFAHTNVGTPFYMSPEMINELKYNDKSDIWATGCLLYELAALRYEGTRRGDGSHHQLIHHFTPACRPPFEATNHVALAVKINAGRFPRIPARYSDQLQEAIRWMLSTSVRKALERPCSEHFCHAF